jgi:dienelactone hydrolase
VLIWPDAFGLRPSMRDIAERHRGRGYSRARAESVLRVGEGAGLRATSNFDFSNRRRRSCSR